MSLANLNSTQKDAHWYIGLGRAFTGMIANKGFSWQSGTVPRPGNSSNVHGELGAVFRMPQGMSGNR